VSGTPGRAAIDEQLGNARPALLPSVELPAPVEELAAGAAARLGWHGTVLPPMTPK